MARGARGRDHGEGIAVGHRLSLLFICFSFVFIWPSGRPEKLTRPAPRVAGNLAFITGSTLARYTPLCHYACGYNVLPPGYYRAPRLFSFTFAFARICLW